jgi:hypothetical protein
VFELSHGGHAPTLRNLVDGNPVGGTPRLNRLRRSG